MSINVEFQAVIMAGGLGNRMYPMTSGHPKCMLPLVNRPLISYQMEILERSGFAVAIAVILATDQQAVQKFLTDEYKGELKVDLVVLDEPMGTADAFRQPALKDKIKTDFFVMSGDLVTNVFLHYLADIHRSRDAACSILLTKVATDKSKDKKKKDKDDFLEKHFIGLDDKKNRLLVFKSASDVEEEFGMSKALLRRHPNITVHNNLCDSHLYIFSPWVLNLIEEKKNISSIQAELLPYLVNHQYSPKADAWVDNTGKGAEQADALAISHAKITPTQGERYRCFALLAEDSAFCARANTVRALEQMSRHLSTSVYEYSPWTPVSEGNCVRAARGNNPDATFGQYCVVGEKVVCESGVSVKKSILGHNVTVKANSKVVNSIVFDNAVIEGGVTLMNCVVGRGAHITKGSSLKDCRVGHGCETLTGGLEFKNETIDTAIGDTAGS